MVHNTRELKGSFFYTKNANSTLLQPMGFLFRASLSGIAVVLATFSSKSQTLGFYGGAGISADRFSFDKMVSDHSASFATGPMAVAGFRYHTRQNFDLFLDASIGITKVKLPIPEGYNASVKYEQLQSLVMLGSGLNIPLENSNLMPFISIGASFFDHWGFTSESGGSNSSISTNPDLNTNRWTIVCGAGVDYQFKLFLSSGLNLRFIYTPLNIFPEPLTVAVASNSQSSDAIRLQGKLLQAQLTYRVNLPLAKWKTDYD